MLALLIAVQVFSPFHLATSGVSQNDPTACAPIGPDWTNCADAFSSNDIYALANDQAPEAATTGIVANGGFADATAFEGGRHIFENPRGQGALYAFYTKEVAGPTWEIRAAVSTDGGATWTEDATVIHSNTVEKSRVSVAFREDGGNSRLIVYTVTTRFNGGDSSWHFRRGVIDDAGTAITWSALSSFNFGNPLVDAVIAVAPDNFVHILWKERDRATDREIFVQSSTITDPVAQGDFSAEQQVSVGIMTNANAPQFVALAALPSGGREMVAVYPRSSTAFSGRAWTWNGAGHTFTTERTFTTGAFPHAFSAVAGSGANIAHLIYSDGQTLLHKRWEVPDAFPASTTVKDAGAGESFVSAVIGKETGITPERVRVTYAHTPDPSIIRNKTSDEDVISFGAESTVADEVNNADFLSISESDTGSSHLIHTDQTNFNVIYHEIRVLTPGAPGKNDTAWRNFGFGINPSATITKVEIGVEWFRTSVEPILNVTISWDGGATWATNQTATNKSADDDVVQFLDFTSATAWTADKLNDANLRARVGTNASDARLDYVTVRVNSNEPPQISNFRIQETGLVQDQRDPSACAAFGNNWTNCPDAFTSNNLYAYANGSASTPSLLVNITSTTAATAPVTWGDVPDLSSTVSVAGPGSVLLLAFAMQQELTVDDTAEYRFAIDGTRDGPHLTQFNDEVDLGMGLSMVFAVTGLAAASHTFAVQWQDVAGTARADTGRNRSFQVLEIASGASILVDVMSITAGTAPGGWADVPDLTGTPSVAGPESVVLLLAGVQQALSADDTAEYRFNVDGTREGPHLMQFNDATDQGTGLSIAYARTGLAAGAHTFSLQWQSVRGTPLLDTGRNRTFQVVELTDAGLLVDVASTTAGTAPASWSDVPDLTQSAAIMNANSVSLLLANVQLETDGDDRSADFQLAVDGTREGGQIVSFQDEFEEGGPMMLPWVRTGLSGSHTFSAQWQSLQASPPLDTGRTRTFQVLEFPGAVNDTAWKNFGFALGSGDLVTAVEVGVEWFRSNPAPVLEVTLSWDGGLTWATGQTATNKSADDNAVEFLDFTSATAWTPAKLNDANLQVRAGTQAPGAQLDYVTVRVTLIPSRAGTQLDVDTEYDYLFNVTDADGWSDIATDGNVSLHLWYDGNGTPVTDQRNPTACAAIGNNWTTCQDAFSSNDAYAYANDSASAGASGSAVFNYFDPVEVTPGTASAWVDVDVSAFVPSGATGVILHVVNNAGVDVFFGLRRPPSTDNRIELTYPNTHLWAMIGINDSRVFQANVGDITGMDIWLTGYTGSGVTFFTNAVDKSLVTTGAWVDIDISADTGADTAIGAIIEIDGQWMENFGLRKNGSTDNRVAHGRHTWAIVGVDEGEVLQGQITATTVDFFLVGYVTAGATFFTNAVDKSLTATGSWLDIDISGDTGANTSNGAFIEVNSPSALDYGLRKNGSTENIVTRSAFSNWGIVEVDSNEILEGQIASLSVDFFLVGYSHAGGGANDFKIQRGNVTIPTGQATVTITAGTDYVAPASLSRAFVRIVGTRLSGNGDDTGLGAPEAAQEWMTSISNPGNLLTSITFQRYLASATFTTRIYWEILEFTGPSGGANEMIVRDQAQIEQTTGTQMDGAAATVTDDADVVVFITGQRANGAASGDTDRGLYTAEWVAASDLPRFTRGDGTGSASVSYAVVEFTGASWKVQRAEHTYVASGVEETETITAVNSVNRTFLHAQMRTASGNVDEMGQRVHLSTVTTVSFQLRSGADILGQVGVAWLVENAQVGTNAMNVQRVSGTRSGGLGNPDEWTETITAVASLSTTSIMGETADQLGTGNSAPRGAIGLNLTATSTVTLWRSDGSGGANDYRFEVVEWPTAPGGGGGGGPGNNDTAWRDFGFALSGSITMVEVGVEWFRNNTAPILNVSISWDGGSTWATNQTATNKSADDNTVEFLDFTTATAWTPAKLNDANLRLRVGTNASGARLDYVTVRVTSSSGGELTFGQQTTGANYRIVLTYLDMADPTTASLSEWSVTEGRATYNASASGLTAILSGPTIIGYEFRLALKFGFQVKHAVAPTNSTVGAYNDLDSWNGEVVATDGPHTITLQEASTGEHMEFGVFQYTFVNISADWAVTVGVGQTASTNIVTVFRRSNDDFTLKIWFVTDLIKGGDTIPIANIQILAAADPTDDITVDTAFLGLGEANSVYILGSAMIYFAHSTDTDEDTTFVQFSVTVPGGQPVGLYVANLVIKLEQQPAG